jgi:hypothetical protein
MGENGNANAPANYGASPAADATVVTDDMHDQLKQWPLLAPWLETCDKIVRLVYDRADAAALRHQRMHQRLTKVAAICGTIAVVLVIVELAIAARRQHVGFVDWVEVLAALAALVAVALGLVASRLDSWLVERHKAERCRLLKFGFLIDPAVWQGDEKKADGCAVKLGDQLAAVDVVHTIEEPRKWLTQVHRPPFLTQLDDLRVNEKLVRQLVTYYRRMRLHVQINYFADRINRFALKDRFTRVLPQWLFFISVFAAFVHFVLMLFQEEPQGAELSIPSLAALLAAGMAAILPVLGAGIRTYRMANEFGRNVMRFESTRHVLAEMDRWLEDPADTKTVFLTLWCCEHTLEIEHREWLRLMAETEWFG